MCNRHIAIAIVHNIYADYQFKDIIKFTKATHEYSRLANERMSLSRESQSHICQIQVGIHFILSQVQQHHRNIMCC